MSLCVRVCKLLNQNKFQNSIIQYPKYLASVKKKDQKTLRQESYKKFLFFLAKVEKGQTKYLMLVNGIAQNTKFI